MIRLIVAFVFINLTLAHVHVEILIISLLMLISLTTQARYIAKTVAYLIELITPAEKEVADTILARYVWQNNQYCFNYYTSVSHLEHFYVIDDYVKFPDKGLSAHMKIHFDAFRMDTIFIGTFISIHMEKI